MKIVDPGLPARCCTNVIVSVCIKSVMIINIPWQQSRPTMTRLYSRIYHSIYYRPATALAHLRTGDGRHAGRLHLQVDHQLARSNQSHQHHQGSLHPFIHPLIHPLVTKLWCSRM